MLKIIQDKNLCEKRDVDGMYLCGCEEIVVSDRNNKGVLCHEISHYLWDIGSTKYLDGILDICTLLGVDFWDVVDVDAVSTMVDDYEVLMDEILSYFCEEIYKQFPQIILQSHPIYKIILGDNNVYL